MKKRFFLVLVLTAALLLALGMSTAMATTAEDGHEHWAWCSNPTVCAACGQPYSGDDIKHAEYTRQYNDTEHWLVCTACDEEMYRSRTEHYAYCDKQDVCAVCGQPYSGDDIEHAEYTWQYNDTEHWRVCASCGGDEIGRETHWAMCDNQNVCGGCGQPYSGTDIRHYPGSYQYNESEHWKICDWCSKELYRDEHWANCDNPGVCGWCGQPCSGADIRHEENDDWQHNETECWRVCGRCGEEFYRLEHSARCNNPGVCYRCGVTYSGDNVIHLVTGAFPWQYNETEHWRVCPECGEELYREEHWANCENPGVCSICGQPYSGDDIIHVGYTTWQYNDIEHWRICTECGEEVDREKHWALCDNQDVCFTCGQSISGIYIVHAEYTWQYNDTEHWQVCTRCGEEIDQSRCVHRVYCDNPGVCIECGQPCSYADIQHYWIWQYDEQEHWQACAKCDGAEIFFGTHFSHCDDPNVCGFCGQPYFGDDIRHERGPYQYDETEHWQVCTLCGEEIDREAHFAFCDNPGVCAVCGQPYSGNVTMHTWDDWQANETEHWYVCLRCGDEERGVHWSYCFSDDPTVCSECGKTYAGDRIYHNTGNRYQYDETEHWFICLNCGEETGRGEHGALCGVPGVCDSCGAPYSGSNVLHYYLPDSPYMMNEAEHWIPCGGGCGRKFYCTAHTYDAGGKCTVCSYQSVPAEVTEAPTTAPTDVPTTAPTDAPTEQPTEPPTEAPTTAPTDVPTTAPTDAPTAVPTEAPTTAPTEVPTTAPTDAPTEVPTAAPTTTPTAEPTKAPHTHVFRTFVSQGDGTHRSDCEGCGTFTVENCLMQSRTVNGIACQVCSVCGYTVVSALPTIELPEAPIADVTAVTATGETAPVQVFDVTAALPEDSAFALCLRIVPEEGAALPGGVRITIPCTLDTANLRLIFIADGELPEEVPFEVIDGMLTFTAADPGIFALVPVQD